MPLLATPSAQFCTRAVTSSCQGTSAWNGGLTTLTGLLKIGGAVA